MGTPEFSVPCVHALANHPGCELIAVVCQPDRVRGRKKAPQPPPVKVAAQSLGIEVLQPTRLKTGEFAAELAARNPTLAVVTAYGRILPQAILDLPELGCVNLHASLLPRWRGAAPIQWSIADGDTESGVCLMQMDAGLDTGDVLAHCITPITAADTGQSLHDRLSKMSASLLSDNLPALLAGALSPTPQPESGVTYARMLKREDGQVDWSQSARELDRRIRAFYPWPGAYTRHGDKTLKLFPRTTALPAHGSEEPGRIIDISERGVRITTGDGDLLVEELQLEGRRRMTGIELRNGRALSVGASLG